MTPQALNQSRLDIERLRSAADRLGNVLDEFSLARQRLYLAARGLETIAAWADSGEDVSSIGRRARDTLRLIGEGE